MGDGKKKGAARYYVLHRERNGGSEWTWDDGPEVGMSRDDALDFANRMTADDYEVLVLVGHFVPVKKTIAFQE